MRREQNSQKKSPDEARRVEETLRSIKEKKSKGGSIRGKVTLEAKRTKNSRKWTEKQKEVRKSQEEPRRENKSQGDVRRGKMKEDIKKKKEHSNSFFIPILTQGCLEETPTSLPSVHGACVPSPNKSCAHVCTHLQWELFCVWMRSIFKVD